MSFFSPHILFNVDSRTTAALFSLPRNLFTSKSSNEYIRAGTPQLGMWQHLSSSICFPFFFPYYYFLIVFSLCVCFSFMFLSTSLAIVVWLHSKSTRSWDWSSFNMNGRGEGEQKKKCPLFAREHFYQFFFSSRAIGDLWLQKKFFFFLSIGLFLLWHFFFFNRKKTFDVFIPLCRFVGGFSPYFCFPCMFSRLCGRWRMYVWTSVWGGTKDYLRIIR